MTIAAVSNWTHRHHSMLLGDIDLLAAGVQFAGSHAYTRASRQFLVSRARLQPTLLCEQVAHLLHIAREVASRIADKGRLINDPRLLKNSAYSDAFVPLSPDAHQQLGILRRHAD
jgi:hypothetical protein